ncbi:peptidase domain-containing ABC transporter [Enterobacter kobei]|uniref:peptidase domain-containing ABC transporter n=1 Tax=Enterobacter kobei TaxID=208224 RepID=UPI00287435D9|nr:peptidase domain-containing ABC transporter [Enterobacter kobei]MDS0025194.1 peptidase domain-containing ABC transporter [Enterobacter kobei]
MQAETSPNLIRLGRRVRAIVQSEVADCAFACLAMVAQYHSSSVTISDLKQKFGSTSAGTGLRALMRMAEAIGLQARALRVEMSALSDISLPAILHWDQSHYVVLASVRTGFSGRVFEVFDPASGRRLLSEAELSRSFTGVLVEIEPSEADLLQSDTPRLTLVSIIRGAKEFRRTVILVVCLSVLVQLGTLLLPLLTQVVVDQVVPTGDVPLLFLLILLVIGLLAFSVLSYLVRAQILIYAALKISQHLAGGLFSHMMRLPYRFFDTRTSGDILARFDSTRVISQALAQDLPAIVVDVAAAASALTLLAVYSIPLALVALAGVLLYIVVRAIMLRYEREAELQQIMARAKQESMLLESIRAMVTLKMLGKERDRTRDWLAVQAEAIGHEARVERVRASFDTVSLLTTSLVATFTVLIAAWFVMRSTLTLGMLFAVAAYSQAFVVASLSVAKTVFEFKVLGLHLARVEEVAVLDAEPKIDDSIWIPKDSIREVQMRDVFFAYGAFERPILRGIDLTIRKGQRIGIVGASGCGKTTLLKILSGLLVQTAGDVRVDGMPLDDLRRMAYRKSVASVLQEDTLLAGSIGENIAFFNAEIDMGRVEECARLAAIHDDIVNMPMAYETIVGDMGSSLSAGQRQRVLLARALYSDPQLLILDEGTAHLDPEAASRIYGNLRSLELMIVIVSHHGDAMCVADCVFEMKEGVLAPASSQPGAP